MANYTGTYTISAGVTGTATSATTTTLTNTGAVWPTGAHSLANFSIRILSGTSSPQTVTIVSNTATVITVAAWLNGTPDNTSTYEIVLIFKNADVFTATTTLSTNIITEIADSATLFAQAGININLNNSCTIRWAKTESTLVTIEAQNRTVQGISGFYTGVVLQSALTINPNIQFIRILDCNVGINITPSASVTSYNGIHHIWIENADTATFEVSGAALTSNVTIASIYAHSGGTTSPFIFCQTTNTFTMIYDTCWQDLSDEGWMTWGACTLEWVTNFVCNNAVQTATADTATGHEHRVSRCYIGGGLNFDPGSGSLLGCKTAADAGTHTIMNTVSINGCFMVPAHPGTAATSTNRTSSNDAMAQIQNNRQAISYTANSGTIRTSDSDYFDGNNAASLGNIDTSASTTSTAAPHQYGILSATRTNPRSTRNMPLSTNNVVIGTPSANSVTITFDSQSGASAAQTTTVNVDSLSGQAVLSVASTTPFLVGMVIEIGYGTARSEVKRIASISAGVSLTFETNLIFTHTAVQADSVVMQLRFPGLGFVSYGTSSGVYTMSTTLPPQTDWGLYWTGIKTVYNGEVYSFKQVANSVTLVNLQSNTTYFFTCFSYSPTKELLVGTEFSFTTASSGGGGQVGYAFLN